MRTKFGDYRAKMKAEESRLQQGFKPKFSSKIAHTKTLSKARFIKAHRRKGEGCDPKKEMEEEKPPGSGFKFNFDLQTQAETTTMVEPLKDQKVNKSFHFQRSSNDFRFNFNVT